jgi:ParB-like chromosome segregation protein Spo0J
VIQIQSLPIDSLRPADYNPRKISKEQMDRLKRSLVEFGFVDPVILNTRTGNIVGGHQRVSAAKELGHETVPVVEVDLDEDREKALNVALNKQGGEWDYSMLPDLLNEITGAGIDLELTGFTADDLAAILVATDAPTEDEWAAGMGNVPTGEREPFQQKTFTLSDEQAESVDEALRISAELGPFVDTGNENRNGNALARVCELFVGRKWQ